MNDRSIKPINGVQQSESSVPAKTLTPTQIEADIQHRLMPARQEKAPIETKKESNAVGGAPDVSIHFRVDDETNELTVFVVDRKTKRVVRSIPASELHKLQAGELLKLTA
jgi:uncharacterized FlaG/YvyC family protein